MKITRVDTPIKPYVEKKKVAAYARVSRDSERLLHSLQAQKEYYSKLIEANPEWECAGVFADEAITGTLIRKRAGFQALIEACEEGKIDIILTKSIQRFARNTVDLLNTVRHLKDIGVEVRFEKEHINSMTGDGELMMTILASFAQEEVRSLSDNVRWSRKRKIDKGEAPIKMQVTGYRWADGELVIEPGEAKLIRRIFSEYMDGRSPGEICKGLKADGIKTIRGHWFQEGPVYKILRNPIYRGDLYLQKTYIEDPITKKQRFNKGELPMVRVEEDHEPIIPPAFFDAVQEEMAKRKAAWNSKVFDFVGMNTFTFKVKCGSASYAHSKAEGSFGNDGGWLCTNKDCPHRENCHRKHIPDLAIRQAATRAMGLDEYDADRAKEEVARVESPEPGRLLITLKDGTAYHDYFRGIYETVEMQPKNRNCFSKKIICGCCGDFYGGYSGYMPDGTRRVTWNCKVNKDNTMIHENVLKYRIAEALGWEEFSFERFRVEVEKIIMDRPCHMTIYAKDGRKITAEYYADGRSKVNGKEDYNDSCNEDDVHAYPGAEPEEA